MPNVPQPTLADVQANQRSKMRKLLNERAVFGYSFSYAELLKTFKALGVDSEEDANSLMISCILARSDEEAKVVKDDLNFQLQKLMKDNELTGIRETDPSGRTIDCLTYKSKTAARFVKDKAIELAPDYGISVKKATEWINASYKPGEEYTVVTLREVKE